MASVSGASQARAALEAVAARPVVLRAGRAEIGAEAEAFVRERQRPVRIAFAGSDAVAQAGDEDVADLDLGLDPLGRIGAGGDVDGCDRLLAVADAQIDRLGTVEGRGLRPVAVVERPGAGGADRHCAVEAHGDGVVDRRDVVLLDVVAGAGLVDPALQVDAEAVDHVAGPAAAFALQLQRLLGGQDAAVARILDMEQEIALLAEQAEAVAYLPADLHGAGALRGGALGRQGDQNPRKQPGACGESAEGERDHGPRVQRQS
ncbi:hypothetical protein ABIF81_001306 [Bradyrhizobium daqingense]